ncbi:VWA domain-containing protein [bacterium]|nr:VWA domain-containing protein [bacterium]
MTFNNWDLLLLLIIPVISIITGLFLKRGKALFFSSAQYSKKKHRDKYFIFLIPLILIIFILLLAKPGYSWQEKRQERLTLDLMICFDVSGSMEATDFAPNRLESAKGVVSEFIERMSGNRMGLILFSGFAFTQSPLTFDSELLRVMLSEVETGMVRIGGTAIGDALGVAINRLEKSGSSKERVIVLLTDGESNRGAPPKRIAEIAAKENIRIYTIGMGTIEGYVFTQKDMFGITHKSVSKLNEKLLTEVARSTGGVYFRGNDEKGLKDAYRRIELLEKKKVATVTKKVFYPKYRLLTLFLFFLMIFDLLILNYRELLRL